MRRHAGLAILLLLAACGTPQEQCIQRETRDLRTIDRLIAETEANIERGYALVEVQTVDLVPDICYREGARHHDGTRGRGVPFSCFSREIDTELRPKAIDLNTERAKLISMRDKRRSLARQAEGAAAQCRVLYPE
jgi:hypothetical protein